MENKEALLEPLIERLEALGKTSLELTKLKAIEKASGIASNLTSRVIALIFISLAVVMASIAAAIWLGDVLGRLYYGFLALASAYTIIGLLVYFVMHKWIKNRVGDTIVKQMLD